MCGKKSRSRHKKTRPRRRKRRQVAKGGGFKRWIKKTAKKAARIDKAISKVTDKVNSIAFDKLAGNVMDVLPVSEKTKRKAKQTILKARKYTNPMELGHMAARKAIKKL